MESFLAVLGILVSLGFLGRVLRNKNTTASKTLLFIFGSGLIAWYCLLLASTSAYSRSIPVIYLNALPKFGNLILASLYFMLSRNFLKIPISNVYPLLLAGLAIFGSSYIFYYATSGGQSQHASLMLLGNFIISASWLSVMIFASQDLFRSISGSKRPMHRNRVIHWSQTFVLEILAGIAVLSDLTTVGGVVRLLQVLVLAFVVVTHPLPDIKNSARIVVKYLLVSVSILLILLVTLLVFAFTSNLFPFVSPILIAGCILIILALILKPVLIWLMKISNRLIPDEPTDLQTSMRSYNQKINKILDLQDFAQQILQHIDDIIEIERGYLFNIEKDNERTPPKFILKGYAGIGDISQTELSLDSADPVFHELYINHKPVTQYEIDFLPSFADTSHQLKRRLDELAIEIFIPIVSRDECIGIIGLGTKMSGSTYSAEEIRYLQAISDQSAIALENARLLNGLTRLNNEYRRAYTALDKSNQNLAKAVRQLEKLDRVKSDFLTILSHELRTPLTLISGYAQLLLDEPDILEDPALYPLINGIDEGTKRLEDIIQAMLDMSTIDARSLEVHIQPVNVNDLIQRIQDSLLSNLQERKMALAIEQQFELGTIETDPNLLEKALFQLLSNAIKYSPDASTITILLKELTSAASPLSEPSLEIEIIDQGIGIDKDQIELIFNKFYQTGDVLSHSSGKTKYKGGGPGLGLAIVRGIINDLHGQVWAESHGHDEENPPGSCFYIVLPLRREPTNILTANNSATFPLEAQSPESLGNENE